MGSINLWVPLSHPFRFRFGVQLLESILDAVYLERHIRKTGRSRKETGRFRGRTSKTPDRLSDNNFNASSMPNKREQLIDWKYNNK